MKTLGRVLSISAVLSIVLLGSCRKKKSEAPNYADGIVEGQNVVLNQDEVDGTVNVEGGDLTVIGTTELTGDINFDENDGGEVTIQDNAEVHKINMHNGLLVLTDNATVKTDLNLNSGTVLIGDEHSTLNDTVSIQKINASDSVVIKGGVVVIEYDYNQNSGFLNVYDGAKLIIEGSFNKGGDTYGMRNIESVWYNNNGGLAVEEPFDPQIHKK